MTHLGLSRHRRDVPQVHGARREKNTMALWHSQELFQSSLRYSRIAGSLKMQQSVACLVKSC